MSEFIPSKINLDNINNGKLYKNGDGVQAETLNDMVGSVAYAQSIATNQPDISEASNYGSPSVSIVEDESGARLKFSNLKDQDHENRVSALEAQLEEAQKEINDLYVLSNATVTGTETVTSTVQASYITTTAGGLSGLIDGSLARVEIVYGDTYVDVTLNMISLILKGIASTNADETQESKIDFSQEVELGLYDSLDFSKGIVTRRGYTQVVNVRGKKIIRCGDAWQKEGWFSAYIIAALDRLAAHCDTVYNGKAKWETDIISNMQSGTFEWALQTFNGGEKYGLCGHRNTAFYCIIPNTDLGVSQEDTDAVKIEALRTFLTNNPPVVRYLLDESEATTETADVPTNKYQAWVDGKERYIQGGEGNNFATMTRTYAVIKGVEQ